MRGKITVTYKSGRVEDNKYPARGGVRFRKLMRDIERAKELGSVVDFKDIPEEPRK